jgi:hypothetical protein
MAKGKGYESAYKNTWELPQRLFTIAACLPAVLKAQLLQAGNA